ncbi:MAG: 3-phosphoglycerate dehydrogenase, partial [Gammaproteobacteria bacterium]|nr:3-phosphoglycerate dehydrogenase [Gammaproteobacteria bacterium]
MNTTDRCRVALLQRWPHECGDSYAKRYPHLEIDKLDEQAPPEQLVEAVSRAQIYQARSTRSELPQALWVDKPLLAACPDLLAVSTNGSGYDTVNLDACTEAGVLVVNQAGGPKQAVAEHALAMML